MAKLIKNGYNWSMSKGIMKISEFLKRLELWSFYFFLLTMTLSVRKILYTLKIRSSFNEYSSIYIYLSDIALIWVFFLFILNNKKLILSNISSASQLFHVEQIQKIYQICKKQINNCSTWNNYFSIDVIVPRGTRITKKSYTQIVNKLWIIFPLVAVLFSFTSILWTTYQEIAIFRSLKLLEFVCLYFYLIHIVPRGTNDLKLNLFHVEQSKQHIQSTESSKQKKCSTWNNVKLMFKDVPRGTILLLIIIGSIQSLLAIVQFIFQRSIGLLWLKESIISSELPGVAKVVLDGNTYIRAYGLFPHPNILGGYLVLSIVLTMFCIKMFHVEQKKENVQNSKIICSTWNKLLKRKFFLNGNGSFVPRGTMLLKICLAIQLIVLVLTFSKSAIFGLIVGLFIVYWESVKRNVSRGTFLNRVDVSRYEVKLFHVEQIKKKILISAILFFSLLIYVKPDYNALFLKTFQERNFYLNVSRGTIEHNFWKGVGAGQSIFQIQSISEAKDWQFQPVHNVFLLVWSEFGIFFLAAFIFFLVQLFKNCSTWNNNGFDLYLRGLLVAFVFIMFFDHYSWDIQQGSMMLWILFSLMATKKISIDKMNK